MLRTDLSIGTFRVWQRNRDVFLRDWKVNGLPLFFEPLMILGLMGLGIGTVVTDLEGLTYFEFLGPGLLVSYVMFAPAFESSWGAYFRMSVKRLYDAMIVTPLSIEDVITGEILWGTTRGVMIGGIVFVIMLLFQMVPSPLAILVLPLCAYFGFMIASMSMSYAAVCSTVNSLNYYVSLFIYPMFFLSGVFFPVADLPRPLQLLAWCMPLTHAVHIARNLMTGHLDVSMVGSMLVIGAMGLFFYQLALRLMRRRLIK